MTSRRPPDSCHGRQKKQMVSDGAREVAGNVNDASRHAVSSVGGGIKKLGSWAMGWAH